MRFLPLLASVIAFAAAAGARAEQPSTIESFGQWHLAAEPEQRGWTLWSRARGTVTTPDVCHGPTPEKVPPAEAAAIRRDRAACLIFHCAPINGGEPVRYEATVLVFGATGQAYDELPRGAPRLRARITLQLDDGPLALDVGLVSPLEVEPIAEKGAWSLVPFRVSPIGRRALERILKSRRAVLRPINQFFGAYIWVVPFTSGAYTFDLSGGAAALARLDERCQ